MKAIRITLAVLVLTITSLQAQQNLPCGTGAPGIAWDKWFSEQIELYLKQVQSGKSSIVSYTIPVIVHVVHNGEAYGTYPNVDSNQVYSQIPVLNADYNGTGAGSSNCPINFSNLIANTGISFCLATKNPAGGTLMERGIDRINCQQQGWTSPATASLDVKNYFNSVIIPGSIWDPTKYLNIWISDKVSAYPLTGFATYPAGTALNGLFGANFGTTTNDGIWVWTKAFGTTGTLMAPWDKGRTATHEIGHWLGLRHIWGDGNCLSDYCNDTPTSKGPHYGCITSTAPDLCGVNQSPNGEMPMNFMDMTNDLCRYMFTIDQNIRIQTAMSQCPNRNLLGTHALCSFGLNATPASSAIASFNMINQHCVGIPVTPFNASSGYPFPTYVWNASPAASFSPAATVANPAIKFNTPGTYTISVVATNSVNSSTYSMTINVTGTCNPFNPCLDTLRMIRNVDTLVTLKAPNSTQVAGCQSGYAGNLVGTNCYQDKEFAQFFPPSTYTATPFPQVNSVIILFDSAGTKALSANPQVICKIYGGTPGSGPAGVIGQRQDSLRKIINSSNSTSISYLGNPNIIYTNKKIIPFKFNFASPVIINANSGFYAGITNPIVNLDSIKVFTNTKFNPAMDSSAWFLTSTNTWRTYKTHRKMKIQMAIIPQITCSPVLGINSTVLNETMLQVFPNPSKGIFNLLLNLPVQEMVQIRVCNILGHVISSLTLNHADTQVLQLDLSAYPKGIYLLQVQNSSQTLSKRIVLD